MLPVCTADCCLSHCSIPSLFYLIFVHLFALSRQASYRLPFAIDRLIDMIHRKLLRLTIIHESARSKSNSLVTVVRANLDSHLHVYKAKSMNWRYSYEREELP
jgi:hypothetical protein